MPELLFLRITEKTGSVENMIVFRNNGLLFIITDHSMRCFIVQLTRPQWQVAVLLSLWEYWLHLSALETTALFDLGGLGLSTAMLDKGCFFAPSSDQSCGVTYHGWGQCLGIVRAGLGSGWNNSFPLKCWQAWPALSTHTSTHSRPVIIHLIG